MLRAVLRRIMANVIAVGRTLQAISYLSDPHERTPLCGRNAAGFERDSGLLVRLSGPGATPGAACRKSFGISAIPIKKRGETMSLTPSESSSAVTPSLAPGDLSGKYLTFCLRQEVYGLAILKVQEIIGVMSVTQVPRMPSFVRGVINLRGKIIPVIDLRVQFGLDAQQDTSKTCIIVVQIERDGLRLTMGIIVDEVAEVTDLKDEQIEPPPSFGTSVSTEFLLGMGKVASKVVMLLDIDRILSSQELGLAEEMQE